MACSVKQDGRVAGQSSTCLRTDWIYFSRLQFDIWGRAANLWDRFESLHPLLRRSAHIIIIPPCAASRTTKTHAKKIIFLILTRVFSRQSTTHVSILSLLTRFELTPFRTTDFDMKLPKRSALDRSAILPSRTKIVFIIYNVMASSFCCTTKSVPDNRAQSQHHRQCYCKFICMKFSRLLP